MEMMQILPAAPTSAGTMTAKLPATVEGGLFYALLTQQQAEEIGLKGGAEGDPFAAPWLPSGWPPGVSAVATEEGEGDSWMSSLPPEGAGLEKPGATPGGSVTAFSAMPGSFSGEPEGADAQEEGGKTAAVAVPAPGGDVRRTMNDSTPGVAKRSPAVPGLVSGAPGQAVAPSFPPGTPGRERGEPKAKNPVGILEQRFAAMLRPLEAVSSEGAAVHPAQNVSTLGAPLLPRATPFSTEQPHAGAVEGKAEGVPLAPVGIDPGEFSLNREMAAAENPELPNPGSTATVRTSAPASPPSTTDIAAGKHPVVTESQILDQVIARMAADRNTEASRMSIKLQPEELGRLEIDLTVEQGRIKAQIVAQNQQVQDVLERHLPRLRESLEQQGLKLDSIQVSVDAQGGDNRGSGHHQRQTESHGRSWTQAPVTDAVVECENPVPPAVVAQGKLSLRI